MEFVKYQRLIEIYVKPDLHAKIIKLKGDRTSDQFLRELLNENAEGRKDPQNGNSSKPSRKQGVKLLE